MSFYGWTFILLISLNIAIILADETGIQECLKKEPRFRYQAFNEENLFLQCELPSMGLLYALDGSLIHEPRITWFFQNVHGKLNEIKNLKDSQITKRGNVLWFSPVVPQNSGIYICKTESRCLKIALDVKEKEKCLDYGQNRFYFIVTTQNNFSCPTLHCYQGLLRSKIRWYKNGKELKENSNVSFLKLENENIRLYRTLVEYAGFYMCDFSLNITGKQWIVRAVVDVEIGVRDTRRTPTILYPETGMSIEAELGKPFEFKCRVHFGFERHFKPLIRWEKLYSDTKEQLEQTHLRAPEKDIMGTIYLLTSTLDKVTSKDLNATFRCHAQNSIGNTTTAIKLVKKTKDVVLLVYILCFSLISLLVLVIGSAIVYINWIEIVLLYRNYLSSDETVGDNKDFDAFISYARRTLAVDEQISEDSYDEERFATMLLPSVLEDQYNYKLCLLERDILPGGVYIDEIVQIIKRSRRAIFILSPRYITGPSLFEMHAAITCLIKDEPLKLILIKFEPFSEPDSLPLIVKKALNALPMVNWNRKVGGSLSHDTKFWNRVRYHMPVKKTKIGPY